MPLILPRHGGGGSAADGGGGRESLDRSSPPAPLRTPSAPPPPCEEEPIVRPAAPRIRPRSALPIRKPPSRSSGRSFALHRLARRDQRVRAERWAGSRSDSGGVIKHPIRPERTKSAGEAALGQPALGIGWKITVSNVPAASFRASIIKAAIARLVDAAGYRRDSTGNGVSDHCHRHRRGGSGGRGDKPSTSIASAAAIARDPQADAARVHQPEGSGVQLVAKRHGDRSEKPSVSALALSRSDMAIQLQQPLPRDRSAIVSIRSKVGQTLRCMNAAFLPDIRPIRTGAVESATIPDPSPSLASPSRIDRPIRSFGSRR